MSSETNDIKHIRDIESLEDLKSKDIEWSRGKTPEDIKDKCLKLCQDYIGGDWLEQSVDSIEVRRLMGGMSNQMYYCGIAEPNPTSPVPQEVAIRLYGQLFEDPNSKEKRSKTADVIVSTLASVNKLGPHLYGLFEGGQIQKYYKHRNFLPKDQSNDSVVRQVFQTLAKWHSLKVPTSRDSNGLASVINHFYDRAFTRKDIRKELEEYDCQTLLNSDLKQELEYCIELCRKSDSPLVFGHNDFRSGNIMITEPDDVVVVCDFEASGYAYRGYDFASLFREWGAEEASLKSFQVMLADDSVIRPLIQIYVDQCERIHGKQWSQKPINSVDHIVTETKVFLLFYALFICLVMLCNDQNGLEIGKKLSMALAENGLKAYFQYKHKLLEQDVCEQDK